MSQNQSKIRVYIDGDACPFKEEIIEVCRRHSLLVVVVSNRKIKSLQGREGIECLISSNDFDAADRLILSQVKAGELIISADLELIRSGLKLGAKAFGYQGRPFDENNLNEALQLKHLYSQVREAQKNRPKVGTGKKKGSLKSGDFKGSLHNYLVKIIG